MLSWHSNPYRHWGEPIVLSRCCKYYICHQPPAIRRETAGQVREPAAAPRAGRLEMKPERVLKQIGGILTDSGNRVNPWRHSAASKRSRSTNRAGTNLACLQEPCLKQLTCYHKGQKKKSTKGHEGRRRATKGLEKTQEGSAKGREGRKDFHQGRQRSVKRAKDESAKGFQGVGKDSKGIREGPRRTLRFSTNAHSKNRTNQLLVHLVLFIL